MPIAAFRISDLSPHQIRQELALCRVEFHLSKKFLDSFASDLPLTWSKPLRFRKDTSAKIPHSKGVYVFSIRSGNALLPSHRLVFYVGHAGGNDKSKNTLRKRFQGYFRETRVRLLRFFDDYRGDVDYQYCALSVSRAKIRKLEKDLNDVLQPPANQNDFSVKVSKGRKANLQ